MLSRMRIRLRAFLLFKHDLDEIPVLSPDLDRLSFKQATFSDVSQMRDYEDGFMTQSQCIAKFQAGERLYLIKIDEEIAWLAWARTGRFFHVPLHQWIDLPAHIADIYGVYTKPKFR